MVKNDNKAPVEYLRKMFSYYPETGALTRSVLFAGCRPNPRVTVKGYLSFKIMQRQTYVHQMAWAMHYGYWPESSIDHVNGNPLDNSIANLRLCTDLENSMNCKRHRDSNSQFKGVRKQGPSFLALIGVRGKQICLGAFKSANEAAHAYNKKAIEWHGEFARLNPVGTDPREPAGKREADKLRGVLHG